MAAGLLALVYHLRKPKETLLKIGYRALANVVRGSRRILVNVSIIASVVSVAFGLFNIVANMYSPCSVKALGAYLTCFPLPLPFKVKNFDLKRSSTVSHSSCIRRFKSAALSG